MLSESEKAQLQAEVQRLPAREAAAIEALKIVQAHRGWVSDDAIGDIAAQLGMTAAELDGIATFYNLVFRRKVGAHVILVCDSVSCWVMGYERIRAHLENRLGVRLGETSADRCFTLLPVACLGLCDKAPAMMIDDKVYTLLTEERIDAILESYRKS